MAGRVGEGAGGVSEALVGAAAEARDFALAGLHSDGAHPGVGGEGLRGGVAGAAVPDLGEQHCGADHALGVTEQREEDGAVGVSVDAVSDLAGQLADLAHEGLQGSDEGEHDRSSGLDLRFAGETLWGVRRVSSCAGVLRPL